LEPSVSLLKGFLKDFESEEFPDLGARGLAEFLVEDLGFLGLPELLLSLLILNIFAKIVI
jgi:hypothetical protein